MSKKSTDILQVSTEGILDLVVTAMNSNGKLEHNSFVNRAFNILENYSNNKNELLLKDLDTQQANIEMLVGKIQLLEEQLITAGKT